MSGCLNILLSGGSLLVTANASFFYGSISGAGTAVTSPSCVVTVAGGSGSYSYSWARTSGDSSTSVSSATSSSVTWSRVFGPLGAHDSFWRCDVTDTITGRAASIGGIQAQLERV